MCFKKHIFAKNCAIIMKYRFLALFALLFVVSACTPSLERIKTILDAYISASGEDGSTALMNVEQIDKGIYSGTYSVGKDSLTLFVYPFTAIVKKDQVMQFFKDSDDNKISVITFQTEGQGQYHSDETGLDYNVETKVAYDERIRKEEEERARLAARKSATSGSGLAQKGADYLVSRVSGVIRVLSYRKASLGNLTSASMFGDGTTTYTYKVLATNGYGGTTTTKYDVVFKNGNVIYVAPTIADLDELSDYMNSIQNLQKLIGK